MAPGCTHWVADGQTVTVGFAFTHETDPKLTFTVPPLASAEIAKRVTPTTESVKVFPTTRAGSYQDEVLSGVMSRMLLLLASRSVPRWTTKPLRTLLAAARSLSKAVRLRISRYYQALRHGSLAVDSSTC